VVARITPASALIVNLLQLKFRYGLGDRGVVFLGKALPGFVLCQGRSQCLPGWPVKEDRVAGGILRMFIFNRHGANVRIIAESQELNQICVRLNFSILGLLAAGDARQSRATDKSATTATAASVFISFSTWFSPYRVKQSEALLVAKCFDGIKSGSAPRRIKAKDHASEGC